MPFMLILDEGLRKPAPKAYEWYERVIGNNDFKAIFGKRSIVSKACKPNFKEAGAGGEQKKQKQVQKQEPKPKPAAEAAPKEAKAVNPLEALPPSPWNFFDFKTLMVNHKDKAGGGMDALKEQYDKDGYSFWFFHYDKYGSEGQVLYKTENLMKGFLQRFDHFRKHCLAKMCILNEEPNLEIEGVWCFRGQ